MRLLLTTHRFWPHVGGTEEAAARIAEEFARRGHDVTVATSDEPGSPSEETRDGYAIRRFALRRVGKFRFPPRAYKDFVSQPDWDIVHLIGQRVWSTDYLYRHLPKIPAPIIFTAHGFYQHHMERSAALVNDYYYHVVLPRALRHVALVTADTENERRELESWGVPRERIDVVPLGFDAGELESLPEGFRKRHGIPEGEPLLLYVGGFYRNKRVDRLVEVAAATGARLAVIGKDSDPRRGLAYCERLAKRKGARVHFLGVVDREDVLSAYRESDLFVFASEFEGFGLALLEAMAAGLPFVSSPAGVAPDLAAHGGGVIAEDTRGMADAVRALLADDARRREMAERGRAAAPDYGWDRVADRYLAAYEEAKRS